LSAFSIHDLRLTIYGSLGWAIVIRPLRGLQLKASTSRGAAAEFSPGRKPGDHVSKRNRSPL
jgi:hypothetical protein